MSARVLIFGNDSPELTALRRRLQADYFDVRLADPQDQPRQLAERMAPDAIFVVVDEDSAVGLDLCMTLRSTPSTMIIPLIALHRQDSAERRALVLEAGADDVFGIPADETLLIGRLRAAVRQKLALDELQLRKDTSQRMGIFAAEEAMSLKGTQTARIVIVQDGAERPGSVDEAAANLGYSIDHIAAREGEKVALERFAGDLVVIDFQSRARDPLRLFTVMRTNEATRHVPVLLIVPPGARDIRAKASEIGLDAAISSSSSIRELQARIRLLVWRKRFHDRMREVYERHLTLAITDQLTGLYNRYYFDAHFANQVARANETGKTLGLLMIDIDHFKQVNDRYGHVIGDEILKELANRLRGAVRGFDMVARLGGEEFVIVMPNADGRVATIVAERLLARIADTPFMIRRPGTGPQEMLEIALTVSVGAALTDGVSTETDLLISADEALYSAKRTGRNRYVSSADAAKESAHLAG